MNSINKMIHLDLCIQESEKKQSDNTSDLNEINQSNSINPPALVVDSKLQKNVLGFRDELLETPEVDVFTATELSSIFNQSDFIALKESKYFNNDIKDQETELREKIRFITNVKKTDALN